MSAYRLMKLAAFVAFVALARPAFADDRAEVDKARSAFLRKEYAEVERRLGAYRDSSPEVARDAAVLPDAYFLLAAAYFRLGRDEEARALLDAMAAKRPDAEPDPLLLPPEVVDGFADAKGRIRERVAEQQKERDVYVVEVAGSVEGDGTIVCPGLGDVGLGGDEEGDDLRMAFLTRHVQRGGSSVCRGLVYVCSG